MNEIFQDLANVAIGVLLLAVMLTIGFFVFGAFTKYNDIEQLRKGNRAAGMYMGSKLLGLGIIIAMVSYSSFNWLELILWSVVGMGILSILYVLLDFLTPRFDVCKEIERENMAVAELLRAVIIAASIVIGTFLL